MDPCLLLNLADKLIDFTASEKPERELRVNAGRQQERNRTYKRIVNRVLGKINQHATSLLHHIKLAYQPATR